METIIKNIEAPTVIKNIETPTVIKNIEAPTVIKNIETPTVIKNIETPTVIKMQCVIPSAAAYVGAFLLSLPEHESDDAAIAAGDSVYIASNSEYVNGAHVGAYPGTLIILK